MISALWDFARRQAIPQARELVWSSEMGIALGLATAFGLWGSELPIGNTRTGDVIVACLAYAAIAFGFSVAGLTLVLTAPDRSFAREMAWSDPGSGRGFPPEAPVNNSYRKLLFIFGWTATAHWLVVVGSFALLVSLGYETALLAEGSSVRHRAIIGGFAFVVVYAVELFVITVITTGQVGQNYIERLHRKAPSEDPD